MHNYINKLTDLISKKTLKVYELVFFIQISIYNISKLSWFLNYLEQGYEKKTFKFRNKRYE